MRYSTCTKIWHSKFINISNTTNSPICKQRGVYTALAISEWAFNCMRTFKDFENTRKSSGQWNTNIIHGEIGWEMIIPSILQRWILLCNAMSVILLINYKCLIAIGTWIQLFFFIQNQKIYLRMIFYPHFKNMRENLQIPNSHRVTEVTCVLGRKVGKKQKNYYYFQYVFTVLVTSIELDPILLTINNMKRKGLHL